MLSLDKELAADKGRVALKRGTRAESLDCGRNTRIKTEVSLRIRYKGSAPVSFLILEPLPIPPFFVTMRFSFLFTAAVIAAAATTQSFGAPTTTTPGPSETETYPLQRPVTPRMKYENLNHIVVRANDAVERLDKALSSAISGGKIDASLGPAEKGLGLLAMYLEDAKQGLVNGSIKINNPSQIYGSVLTLKTNVKVVADKVAGLKVSFF